jgi:hypothetical protein
MQDVELDIHVIAEARRQSAAKVRGLLEQLEAAEREFESLTKKMKALSGAATRNDPNPNGGRHPASPLSTPAAIQNTNF